MTGERALGAGSVALALLLFVHAAIHALGFVKSVGFFPALPAISRPLGWLWLAAGALLASSSILLLTGVRAWWTAAAGGLVLSQVAIATAWGAAKWGTLPNVVLLLPLVVAVARTAPSSFESRFRREVTAAPKPLPPPVLTEADLVRLPPAVRAYVRYTGAVGRPRVASFRARFTGTIRSKPDADPMVYEAEQENRFDPKSRLFLLRARTFGIPFIAFHRYVGSSATMEVKVADLLRLVDARGPQMDQSETVTLLNDLCVFAPGNLVDPSITFEELAPLQVKATFENAGHRVSAVLHFDGQGRLVNFHSDDRYLSADGKTYTLYRWSTPLGNYREFDGVRVAAHAQASWRMPEGELVYGTFDLVDLRYNVSEPGH